MMFSRALALITGVALGATLCFGTVSAQTESATAEDGAPASDAPAETAPAETAPASDVPLGANLTPPVGLVPPGPALISAPGTGRSGSSTISMAPGTVTSGVAREGLNAVRAPESEPVAAPAPDPIAETTTEPVAGDAAVADTAVATETDLDADNYADSLEWDLGLDPNNADSDGDGTADGDELNIYGTDPTVFDTDGDGAGDGEELFGIQTDPLVWDDFSAPAADGTEPVAAETTDGSQELAEGTAESVEAVG